MGLVDRLLVIPRRMEQMQKNKIKGSGRQSMRKNNFYLTGLVVLMAVSFLGLSLYPVFAADAPRAIQVGVMVSMTGPDAAIGSPATLGYEIAVEEINKSGGVMVKAYGKKIPIELVIFDMETNPEKAISRAEALNSKKVPVVVGTTLIGAAAEIFEKNKLPAVTVLSGTNAITERGLKHYFALGTLNSDIAKAVLDLFSSLPKGTIPAKWAFLEEQSDFSMEFFSFAKQMAAKHGIKVVYENQYAMMTPDLSALISGAKNAGAEVVLAFPTPPDAITMLKQMAQLGYRPKSFVALRASDDPSWGKLGNMGNYSIGAPDWHPALSFPGIKELNATVKAKTGQPTNPTVGPAYASIKVVAAAIEKAGSLDREAIRKALSETDMMTVLGPTKFTAKNTRANPYRPVVQWQNGVMELVWPADQRKKPLVYPIPGSK